MSTGDLQELIQRLRRIKGKAMASTSYAIFVAGVYCIWRARNAAIFKQTTWPGSKVVREIMERVRTRILYLNSISGKYAKYIYRILML